MKEPFQGSNRHAFSLKYQLQHRYNKSIWDCIKDLQCNT